ncbi:MAG: response regulator [Elusimicrobia bacterium]|nr:response regulator [Elusimicrobiota bacterium]
MSTLPKILLVDDEKGVRESMKELLEEDYCVINADSGEAAVEVMKKTRPDLIILDVKLPGVDGIKTLQIIKNIDSSIPVIMLSVVNTISTITKLFKLGAYDYFDKPFSIYELKKSIKGAIDYGMRSKKCENYDVPAEIELFIKKSADDMLKDKVGLKHALERFDSEYVDLISRKCINEHSKN